MEDLGRHALIAENHPFACILVCLCARTRACERAPMRTTVHIQARAQTHERTCTYKRTREYAPISA
jgi:hypothetical protein